MTVPLDTHAMTDQIAAEIGLVLKTWLDDNRYEIIAEIGLAFAHPNVDHPTELAGAHVAIQAAGVILDLRQQRDDLLQACKALTDKIAPGSHGRLPPAYLIEEWRTARAAIARITGDKGATP